MKIKVNELWREEENPTVLGLKNKYKKDADVIILNGFPVKEDKILKEGDRLVLIKKGQVYNKEELEALMSSRHTPGVHEKVKRASVTICGVGGLGSNIAISLGRMGVSKIKLIDFDIVEPSNLNRQQYFIEDIGEYKVEALKRTLNKINPFIEIESIIQKIEEENIEELLSKENLIIEAFDNPSYKALLTNYILQRGYGNIICGSGMAGYYSSNSIVTKRVMNRVYICGDFKKEAKEGEGLMAPRVSVCANHMANMALRIIVGEGEV